MKKHKIKTYTIKNIRFTEEVYKHEDKKYWKGDLIEARIEPDEKDNSKYLASYCMGRYHNNIYKPFYSIWEAMIWLQSILEDYVSQYLILEDNKNDQ